jgi:hypothetical protein
MFTKRFLLTGFLTSLINLTLNALAYAFVLRAVYRMYPGPSGEFTEQLSRKPGELVIWAMVLTTLGMGYFITLIMHWSLARTFGTGLKYGSAVGILFWSSVNFGLYASSHMFSLIGVLTDLCFSSLAMSLSAAFAAWMLGKGEYEQINSSNFEKNHP